MRWQPIETAPYGERLLLNVPGTGVTVGTLSSGDFVIDVLNDCRETYATHWMPFPEPPAIAMETQRAETENTGSVAKP